MAVSGRLQPFVAVTQSNAFAVPAKGNLRPETVIALRLAQCPLTDQKAAIWIPLLKPPVLTFFAWTGCLAAEERNRLVRI
jgi:hypothetical protein